MQDTAYLGDLGGLAEHLRLVLLDNRGTGASGTPADASSYRCEGAYDPPATRAALALHAPVLLLAGEHDVGAAPPVMAEFAAVFADATLVVQPAAGRSPWLDDPALFTAAVKEFLGGTPAET